MLRIAVAVAVAVAAALSLPAIAAQQIDVNAAVQVLKSGTLSEREALVDRVIRTRAAASSAAMAQAVADELLRMSDVAAERQRRIAAGAPDATAPDIGEYLAALVQACSQSPEPVVIDGLISVIDTGNMAQAAIARFGALAFDRTSAVALHDDVPSRISGALYTLGKMAASGVLTQRQQTELVDVARARLQGVQPDVVWSAAMKLAIATGDPALRAKVQDIALGRVQPGITGAAGSEWVQAAAKRLLGIK
jgi:hypothetical protein